MDLENILLLIEKFNESTLTELALNQDGTELTLKRVSENNPVYTQPIMVHPQTLPVVAPTDVAAHVAASPDAPAPVAGESGTPAVSEEQPGVEIITSPIVGTFYRSPSPDSPPFCHEGDVVEKGKPLCILEAMKVMNELESEFSMEIVAFRVNNGDMVEYGTPLIEVRRV